MALAPVLIFMATLFGKIASTSASKSLIAYGQSAGYAEQAISAIRVVVAFGMED